MWPDSCQLPPLKVMLIQVLWAVIVSSCLRISSQQIAADTTAIVRMCIAYSEEGTVHRLQLFTITVRYLIGAVVIAELLSKHWAV